jgi:hypothetical protein
VIKRQGMAADSVLQRETPKRRNRQSEMLDGVSVVACVPAPVPVLLFTGPTGAGKSTVAAEASRLLQNSGVPHAMVDLAVIAQCWPRTAEDPWNEALVHRNLTCIWRNFHEAGADRLILCRVLEDRSLLRHVAEAVPGAEITVVRLTADLNELHARIRRREAGRDPSWYLDTAAHLIEKLDRCAVEDLVVRNQGRTAAETADEALHLVGWLPKNR